MPESKRPVLRGISMVHCVIMMISYVNDD